MTKFVFVTGGVMSGIGKGVVSASVGRILQARGVRVSAIKIDPYLNFDAGTMNPYIHGEVFVTEDGGETDMDIGTYERFLDLNLSKDHNITTGQVYHSVIQKERKGDFLGRCVQIIPHITDEIKERLHDLAKKAGGQVLTIEIGGTVGDIEGLPYLEAARQMKLEEAPDSVLNIHVTLVPILDVVGEQKTKPTQHSVQELRRIGIQPDIIVARSKSKLQNGARRKIALFCNVHEDAVFTSVDMRSIYESPLLLDEDGLGDYVSRRLSLGNLRPEWASWKQMLERHLKTKHRVRIAVCGKYAELADSYVSVNEALKHAGAACGTAVELDWVETDDFEKKIDAVPTRLQAFDGILVPGGFGTRGAEGKITTITYARESNVPFLGICFGFQLAVVEFARRVGFKDANSAEISAQAKAPVIDLMPEQTGVEDLGGTMRLGALDVVVSNDTLAWALYRSGKVRERHRHRYEVNPEYIPKLTTQGLVFSGKSPDGRRMEILEYPKAYFFLATQFHPEFKSRPSRPSPPYYGFVKAALDKSLGKTAPQLSIEPLVEGTVRS